MFHRSGSNANRLCGIPLRCYISSCSLYFSLYFFVVHIDPKKISIKPSGSRLTATQKYGSPVPMRSAIQLNSVPSSKIMFPLCAPTRTCFDFSPWHVKHCGQFLKPVLVLTPTAQEVPDIAVADV